MKFKQDVGITSYGAYLPQWKLLTSELECVNRKKRGSVSGSLGVKQKTVPALDEDTVTISTEAAAQAFSRQQKKQDLKKQVGAVFIGSESHPYAVKPSGTVVKQALGLPEATALADLQFACKAGTQALQICAAYAASSLIKAGLAIGADTAQAEPGDALEYTAAAGGAAFIVGQEDLLAKLTASCSIASDTPDFWRRPGEAYPQHAGRFTGGPAYFYHIKTATKALLKELGLKPKDIDFCVFHTPNAKFPKRVAKMLGFTQEQLKPSLVVESVGNTYAGASMLALAAVLDQASANKKILVTSYGSGAGADSFLFETTKLLTRRRECWKDFVTDQIKALKKIDYQTYRNWLEKRGH